MNPRNSLMASDGQPRVRWNGPDEVVVHDYDLHWGDDYQRRFRVVDGRVFEVQNHITGALGTWVIGEELSDRREHRLVATPATLLKVIQREYTDRERNRRNGHYD